MSSTLFGDWLKTERQARGLTQGDLEKRATLGHAYVSKVERGRTKLPEEDTRKRIHEALGTSEDDLVRAGILRTVEHAGNVVYLPQSPLAIHALPDAIEHQAIRELAARYDTSSIHDRLHVVVDRMSEQQATVLLLMLEVFEDSSEIGER